MDSAMKQQAEWDLLALKKQHLNIGVRQESPSLFDDLAG
jgi:hypothetical protein